MQISRLQQTCKQRDQQIAEANAMRSNLMAAMGIGQAMPSQIQSSLPHRTRSVSTRTQHEQNSQLGPSPPSPSSADGMESQLGGQGSFASTASSDNPRNGPTPKRAKPRKSTKAPSPAKTRLNLTRASRVSATGIRTVVRQPLLSRSVNRVPEKDTLALPSKVTTKRSAEDRFTDPSANANKDDLHCPVSGGKMDLDMSGMLGDETLE